MLIEQIVVKCAWIMNQRVAQVRQNLQAVSQSLWNNLLGGNNAQQFMKTLWTAQPKRGDQRPANLQARLNCQLQVSLRQAIDVIVSRKLLALLFPQAAQNSNRFTQLFDLALYQLPINRQHLPIQAAT